MGLLDSLMPSGGLLGMGGMGNAMNPGASLLGGLYDPKQMQNIKLKNMLFGTGIALLGQGPSPTPITFGSTIGKGLASGLTQAQQAGQDYMQNAIYANQLKRQQGLDASQKQLTDFQIQGAQRDATNAEAHAAWLKNQPADVQEMFAVDPAGASAKYFVKKYGAAPQWGVIRKDAFGNDVYGYVPTPDAYAQQQAAANQPPPGAVSQQQSPQIQSGVPGGNGLGIQPFGRFDTGQAPSQPSAAQPFNPNNPQDEAAMAQLHGDDFLKNLDPQIANQVKGIAEGRLPYPSGMGGNSPVSMRLKAYVNQYDPTFNSGDTAARFKMITNATNGSLATSNNGLNTAIGHLGELKDAYDGLGNFHSGFGSSVANSIYDTGARFNQSSARTKFDTVVKNLAPEIVRAYRGAGGAEGDILEQLKNFKSAASPEQAQEALSTMVDLLTSKIDANQRQYDEAMGSTGHGKKMISPEAEAVFAKIKAAELANITGGSADAQPPQAAPPGRGNGPVQGKTSAGVGWSFQ